MSIHVERDGELSVHVCKPLVTVPTTEVEGVVVTGADGEDNRGREAGTLPIKVTGYWPHGHVALRT